MRSTTMISAMAIGLALAACGAQTGGQPNITVNTGENQTGISVSGMGEVTGTPDTVEIDLGVSVLEDTVEAATSAAASKASALIEALKSNGVAAEDITTTDYSIYPEYDYRSEKELLIGYRVTNTVRAKLRNVQESGSVIDAATEAGGDDVRVNGLRFSIEDNTELIEAAREAAWTDALAKATQLAALSGQTLGKAVSINESISAPPGPVRYYDYAAAAEGAFDTPIEPGTSAVTITLSVQFELTG